MHNQKRKKKFLIVLSSVLMICLLASGVTLALYHSATKAVTNEFDVKYVNIGVVCEDAVYKENVYEDELTETIQADGCIQYTDCNENALLFQNAEILNGVSKSFLVKNINLEDYPTADTYVRVRLVAMWRNDDGSSEGVPVDHTVYSISYDDSNWKQITDSYGNTCYYYKSALAPDQMTDGKVTIAINAGCTVPAGCSLEIQVLADGVKADNSTVKTAWGDSLENILE